MIDGLEHRAEIAVPVSSRRKFIRTAAVTGGAGLLLEGIEPIRAQESGKKAPLLVLPGVGWSAGETTGTRGPSASHGGWR